MATIYGLALTFSGLSVLTTHFAPDISFRYRIPIFYASTRNEITRKFSLSIRTRKDFESSLPLLILLIIRSFPYFWFDLLKRISYNRIVLVLQSRKRFDRLVSCFFKQSDSKSSYICDPIWIIMLPRIQVFKKVSKKGRHPNNKLIRFPAWLVSQFNPLEKRNSSNNTFTNSIYQFSPFEPLAQSIKFLIIPLNNFTRVSSQV